MWIINCVLLVLGTVASVCGISFYLRNREATGNIRFYIFSYGNCAAIWCYFFGLIGFCDNLAMCSLLRKIGDIGIIAFLITETFLVTDISGASKKVTKTFKALSIIAGVADYLVFSQDHVNAFVRMDGWTTWVADPDGAFNRAFHSGFIIYTFFVLSSFGIVWIRNNREKRLRRFLYTVFIANFMMLSCTFPDTFLPAMGKPAVSTSGIGAALCSIVMWYGATQLGAFDIRMGNIRDRLFDFIEAGVIVLDVEQKIAVMNRYSKKLAEDLGIMGNRIDDFFAVTDEEVQQAFRSSVDEVYTGRVWNREGNRAYSIRLSAVKDNYGEVFCFLCVFVDVTEEVEAVSRFEVASRAKSRFLAQMSHEIRTPINAVLGMNEMILRESEDAEILEYAGNIDSAGNTLLTLINSILDFSKIEDGKMEIVPVKYDTASFINDLYHSIVQRADAKGLAIELVIDETLPCTLVGDDVRVSQVIMNLLTNAVKYTEKGSVTLSLQVVEKEAGKVKLSVSVRDTGIGIRKEDRERLFESFERLDEVRNHNIEGTGLGISIVTSLLEMMGSRLQVESTYGEGSVFSFTIVQEVFDDTPIGDYEKRLKESAIHKDKDDVIHASNARILVVDDNDMNLKVARNLLKLCGIRPMEASSGEETINRMREDTYDIVFLDHMMPGMDGIETLHRLRKEGLLPEHTVVIALTANAVVGAREAYLKEGFTDYLSKPIEIRHLVEKLMAYLPESAYRDGGEDPMRLSGQCDGNQDSVYDGIHTFGENEETAEAVYDGIMEFTPFGDEDIQELSSAWEGNRSNPALGWDGDILEFGPEDEDGLDDFGVKDRETGYDIDRLKAAGFDVAAGLHYCANDEALYFDMLDSFVHSCEGRLEELEGFFQHEDWHGYEVAVHALKSNCRMIGLNTAYEQARALEEAAEKQDTAYIKAEHPVFLDMVRNAVGEIGR